MLRRPTLPQVLAVGAIGQLGTFPPEDTDSAAVTSPLTPEGFFVPAFGNARPDPSRFPAVDCCAPGVAVISGLPPSSYGPLSGTGTAAAHVTALAALILAHHPTFRAEPDKPSMTRDSARPARLLEIIRGSCRLLPQLDPALTGAGIPDAAVALSVVPWGTHPPLSLPYPAPAPTPDGRTPLEPLDAAMQAAGLIHGDGSAGR
jgi:subtilisin family serine protease